MKRQQQYLIFKEQRHNYFLIFANVRKTTQQRQVLDHPKQCMYGRL